MLRLRSSAHKIDTILVMVLLTLFGITAFILVFIGVKQYKVTVNTMNHNYETRTATSFLIEKIHQADKDACVSITEFYDTTALTITSTSNGNAYYTYIYFYEGYLRELFVSEHAKYSPDSGQEIVAISNLSLDSVSPDLVKATITDTHDNDIIVYLSMKSKNRKELL